MLKLIFLENFTYLLLVNGKDVPSKIIKKEILY